MTDIDDSPSCCIFGDVDDPIEVLSEGIVKARKEHHCIECDEVIAKGVQHESTTGKSDGLVSTYRTCLSCVEIRNHFAKLCRGGWIYGEVWTSIEESFFPDMKAGGGCLTGLSPAAKGRLFERRLQWLEDSR